MVIFVIFFPGMLNKRSIFFYKVNSLGIGTKWKTTGTRKLDWSCDEVFKTSGALWADKYLQVVMTSQNVDIQELQFQIRKFKLISAIDILSIFREIPIGWIPQHLADQHWLRQWLGAVRQQAITWANVDPDFWPHMASLGDNGLS